MVAVHYVFGNPKNIQFKGSKRAQKFLKGVDEMLNNLKKDKEQTLLAKILRSAKKATVFLFKSFKDKRYAKHLWVRLTSKAWYKAYFLGK